MDKVKASSLLYMPPAILWWGSLTLKLILSLFNKIIQPLEIDTAYLVYMFHFCFSFILQQGKL